MHGRARSRPVKIEAPTQTTLREVRRSRAAGHSGAGGFVLGAMGEAAAAAGAPPSAPTGAISALLALQEVHDASQGRSAGLRLGHDLLDRLDALRFALLDGRVSRSALTQLAGLLAAKRTEVADPRLVAVLAEIELRAAVELAKLEQGRPERPIGTT